MLRKIFRNFFFCRTRLQNLLHSCNPALSELWAIPRLVNSSQIPRLTMSKGFSCCSTSRARPHPQRDEMNRPAMTRSLHEKFGTLQPGLSARHRLEKTLRANMPPTPRPPGPRHVDTTKYPWLHRLTEQVFGSYEERRTG